MTKYINKWWVILILILVVSLPAMVNLLPAGYYGAHDDLHVAWLYEMDQVVKLGQIPPRYVPDLSYGFGYPLFNFVYPLPFYLAEVFHLAGFNLVDSVKIIFALSLPLSAFFMYLLLREFTGKKISLAGATIYLYTPYRAVDLYVRGAFGELLSFVFLPLVLLSIVKVTGKDKTSYPWMALGALSVAALVLTHNITTYMFLPFAFMLGLMRIVVNKNIKQILNLILLGAGGLLVSLYFWLPALLDSSLVEYDPVFNFVDHFPTIRQLIIPFWGYGTSVAGPYDGLSFNMGVINWVILLLSVVLIPFIIKKTSIEKKALILWCYGSFLLAFYMMNFRSSFFWANLPLISYFQFPWRFLVITTIVTPILLISLEKVKWGSLIAIILGVIAIGLNVGYFKPSEYLDRFDSYYINRYIPVPNPSSEYRTLEEEYLRLPLATIDRPKDVYPCAFTQPNSNLSLNKINNLNCQLNISSSSATIVSFNKYYFPGMQVKLDGKVTSAFAGKPFGQVSINVPEGNHSVQLQFVETNQKRIFDLVSLISLLVSGFIIWKYKTPVKN